jgi:hypothetical protein
MVQALNPDKADVLTQYLEPLDTSPSQGGFGRFV